MTDNEITNSNPVNIHDPALHDAFNLYNAIVTVGGCVTFYSQRALAVCHELVLASGLREDNQPLYQAILNTLEHEMETRPNRAAAFVKVMEAT